MNSDSGVLVPEGGEKEVGVGGVVIKCFADKSNLEDCVDKSQSPTSSSQQQQQQKPKKMRKSLTSFSIFRKDKKFSESPDSAVEVKQQLVPQTTKNNLVLDNTRLEVN